MNEDPAGAKAPSRASAEAGGPPPMQILVVDDEEVVRESLRSWFEEEGYLVDVAASGKDALTKLAEHPWDLFILDVKMPGMDGLELQRRIKEAFPEAIIIIMTAYASVDTAVSAMKDGAHDYISKPFDPDDLDRVVRNAFSRRHLEQENERLKANLEGIWQFDEIVGLSPAIQGVLELVRMVAEADSTVLIRGESGTGKELVARAIHAHSSRRYMPIVIVNCGALPEGVLESELFGHERGAFTGAQYRHKGKFELADGGTIFLDEIGDISPKTQMDLLRVLEEKAIYRVGGTVRIPVDFRVVAATNRDLEAMVAERTFREDLYYRLNVFTIPIPPLRERREDIPVLAEHFLSRFCRAMNKRPKTLSASAMRLLTQHEWPGNVRELQNAIERAVVISKSDRIEGDDLPLSDARTGADNNVRTLADAERQHIEVVLGETDWNISQAARILDIDRVTLYNKIRRFSLRRPGA
jgi:two-component system, NtrC family, response regulator HydG